MNSTKQKALCLSEKRCVLDMIRFINQRTTSLFARPSSNTQRKALLSFQWRNLPLITNLFSFLGHSSWPNIFKTIISRSSDAANSCKCRLGFSIFDSVRIQHSFLPSHRHHSSCETRITAFVSCRTWNAHFCAWKLMASDWIGRSLFEHSWHPFLYTAVPSRCSD